MLPEQSLRPLNIGQILDRAIRLYRRNFLTFTGIVALMLVPITLFQLVGLLLNVPNSLEAQRALQNFQRAANPLLTYFQSLGAISGGPVTIFSTVLQTVLVQGLAMAALSRAVANNYLGQGTDIFSSYGKSAHIWVRLLLAMFIFWVLSVVLLVLAIFVPCVGWIFGFGVWIYATMVLSPLYVPILVLEGKRPWASIRRAWDLARRRFWWVLGFMIVLTLFAQLVISGPALLVNYLSTLLLESLMPTAGLVTQTSIQLVIRTLVSLFLSLVYLPLQMTAIIVMYFDLRVRTEGFDIAIMASRAEAESVEADVERVLEEAPDPESADIVTGNELLYFGGVAVGAVALLGGFYFLLFAGMMALIAASGGF